MLPATREFKMRTVRSNRWSDVTNLTVFNGYDDQAKIVVLFLHSFYSYYILEPRESFDRALQRGLPQC